MVKAIHERKTTNGLALAALLALPIASAHAQAAVPAFPGPNKIIKDDRQFSAVTPGPGNTFRVHEPPANYELDAFDFENEEETMWLEWRSGRLETRDLDNGKRVAESKPLDTPVSRR